MIYPYKIKDSEGNEFVFAEISGGGFPNYRCNGNMKYIPDANNYQVVESEAPKKDCKLIGADGNIFNLMAIVARTMRCSPYWEQRVDEMFNSVKESGNYYIALTVLERYVNII